VAKAEEEGSMTTAEAELFDGREYEIPFPLADGKEVNELVLRLGGTLKLNRNDPEHVALVESLNLGRIVNLSVTAAVASKGASVKEDIGGVETVTHNVALQIHDLVETE
jgi:hypothetical protein